MPQRHNHARSMSTFCFNSLGAEARAPPSSFAFSNVSCAPGHPNSTINTAGNVAANVVCRWVGDLPSPAREHHKSSDLKAVQPGEDANTAPPAAESLLALAISTGHCTNNVPRAFHHSLRGR
ncbi:hypothetical protein V8D89_003081 [Ganoderma adspersum]